jgi:hypothetical protein
VTGPLNKALKATGLSGLCSVDQLVARLAQALQTPDVDRAQLSRAVEDGVRGAVREIAMGFFHDAALLEDEARTTVHDPGEMGHSCTRTNASGAPSSTGRPE